ncbi:hypothetical protein [Methylobacterium sp. SyP6R]|uniref:hypothetical protein n=1 Tax=Methylobacterium sp. SyP6R TaxID=2718876 RepID=UPI001F1718EC|nr:hypothetical protein [Methylobacterium sp. SyP6R]MCF4130126.1 hypothetical protein [Methylobacterium sp. SyP6R]
MNVKDIYYRALASVTMVGLSAMSALAQATSGDPSAPIDFLKTARQKASSSSLNASSIATGGNNAGIVISIIFAVVGIGLAGISAVKLYKSSQDDNAREDAGRSLAGLVVGSGVTILGVIIGVVTTYMIGSGT